MLLDGGLNRLNIDRYFAKRYVKVGRVTILLHPSPQESRVHFQKPLICYL